jgi:hypothetical protein
VLREDNVKVTLSLSQRSLAFFKRAALKRRVPYQRMIRALVDAYAEKQRCRAEQDEFTGLAFPPSAYSFLSTLIFHPTKSVELRNYKQARDVVG